MNLFVKIKNLITLHKISKLPKEYFRIFTHLTDNEKKQLFYLARNLEKNAVAVEIGSYLGASSCFLASGIKYKSSVLHCVDTWENHAMSEGRKNTFHDFKRNTLKLRDKISIHRGISTDVAQNFNQKIDLCFFDGDHSYEGIKSDWESWKRHLTPGATVVFHDISWAEGVQKVVQDDVIPALSTSMHFLDNMCWGKTKASTHFD